MPSNFKMNKPKLEGHSVEHTYLRQRAFDGSVNKTILKPQLAVAARQDFPDVKFHLAAQLAASLGKTVFEMTYNVSSGTLNSTILYHT